MKRYIKSGSIPYESKRNPSCPYKYVLKHGLGPGTLPKDITVGKVEDVDEYVAKNGISPRLSNLTMVWLDRPLSYDELKFYDIPSETEISKYVPVKSSYDVENVDRYSRYAKLARKSVQDSDGFYTDYTLYKDRVTGLYFCMFGDEELYEPNPDYADVEFTDEREAYEWFEDYYGFAIDDRSFDSSKW